MTALELFYCKQIITLKSNKKAPNWELFLFHIEIFFIFHSGFASKLALVTG
jgi:hypothetical protein